MSADVPKTPSKKAAAESAEEEISSLVPAPIEDKIEEIIEAVPADQKEPVRHLIRDTLFALVERSSSASIPPETAKILAASADKESDNKFQWMMKKADNEEKQDIREHELNTQQHKDRFSIIKPAFYFSLFVIAVGTGVGIWLCYVGKDVLGGVLISAVWAGALGFLAGMGSGEFFKNKPPQ